MKRRRPKVILYGLMPTLLNLCSPCCRSDTFMLSLACGNSNYSRNQVKEYPEDVVRAQDRMAQAFQYFIDKYGGMIRVRIVDMASIEGMYYALRYGLREPCILVEGRTIHLSEFAPERVDEVMGPLLRHASARDQASSSL